MSRIFSSLLFLMALAWAHAADAGVAAGYAHSMALTADGNIYTWGSDYFGQLGQSRTLFRTKGAKVDLPAGVAISTFAAGRGHTLALNTAGDIYTWGQNDSGQLGDGSFTGRSTPAKIANVKATAVSAGKAHSVALQADGSVLAWGVNDNAELGNDSDETSKTPVKVLDLPAVKMVKAGYSHTAALDAAGRVWTWGDNSYGQLGDDVYGFYYTAGPVTSLPVKATLIEAGGDATYALDTLGRVWAWGRNDNYQLGNGTLDDSATPILVPGLDKVIAISASRNDVAVVRSDGTFWFWGGDNFPTPTRITGVTGKAVGVSNGELHTLILMADGSILATGSNDSGQLGNGTTTDASGFTTALGLPVVKAVGAGLYHSLALANDGTLYAWGNNAQGELGEAAELEYNVPRLVKNMSGIVQVASGDSHSLALGGDGTVWAWGNNYYGSLGDGSDRDKSTPVKVLGLPAVKLLRAGGNNSAAIASDGSVWTWGANFNGQIGVNSTTVDYYTKPQKVPGLSSVIDMAIGTNFMLALKSDGTVWAWGKNKSGQLGLGDKTQRKAPTQIASLSNVIGIAAGDIHSVALKRDGTVWAWGYGSDGQLGNSDSPDDQLTPALVRNLSGIKSVGAGIYMSGALGSNGRIYTWGSNFDGELGTSETYYTPTPVLADGENFSTISIGGEHTLAVKSDGSLWAFGWNGYGQIGDGTFDDQYSYVGVVNSLVNGFLNLSPSKPSLAVPAGKRPPFLVETNKIGGNLQLSLTSNISLNSFADAGAGNRLASSNNFAASSYNVYVAAIIPGAAATATAPARPVSVYLKTRLASWQPYLGGPITEYLRGVTQSSDQKIVVDILTSTDISSLVGTQFLLGYGADANEMLAAGRYRVVYEVGAPK